MTADGPPLRILTLSNCPLREELGSGYVILNYARGLRRLGHTVDLFEPRDFEPLIGWRRGIRYRQALGMAVHALRRLRHQRYDVLEVYGAESWLAISLLARRRSLLVVHHSNGLETHLMEVMAGTRHLLAGLDYRLARRSFCAADALVTVSHHDLAFAAARDYGTESRRLALENPLPNSYLGLEVEPRRRPVILFCGSWIARKGVELIRADLPPLLRELPAWRLQLVGVGTGFQARDHFPADVVDRVEVIPFVEREGHLLSLYCQAAIVIMPSLYESFGLVAAEALACGCALACARTGFGAALVDGEEAVILTGHQPPALYQALRRLTADDDLRQRVALGGWRRVQGLRWEGAVTALATAYQRWKRELSALA